MRIRDALAIAGPLGFPSKMPGTAWGISAKKCITGGKLAAVAGSICSFCYAMKGNYIFPSVRQAHEKRLAGIADPQWTGAMITLLESVHARGTGRNGPIRSGWHRWFDSGDLQSAEHLTKICAVAALTPWLRHWLATRELKIVQDYVAAGGTIPKNLVIRVSATMVDGEATRQWPTTSGSHTGARPRRGRVCPAPTQAGKCGECRACWNPRVKHVSYCLH